jgi:zinc transport system substrate-binding protein
MKTILFTLIALLIVINSLLLSAIFANELPQITVSILPQRFFVKKIAGNLVKVRVMVPPGFNPATYEPSPSQLKHINHSRIYFTTGVPFEKTWLPKLTSINPDILIKHTEKGIDRRPDPHIWLSPRLVKKQVRIIAKTLIEEDPNHKTTYQRRLAQFEKELDELDNKIRRLFQKKEGGREFLVFHPAWGHFASTYGLKQIAVEKEGKEASAKEMATLLTYVKGRGLKTIFVQPQISKKSAMAIARDIVGQIETADPLNENWAKNLEDVALKISNALR